MQRGKNLLDFSLAPRRDEKNTAAAASINFGWPGGAPNFFRRRRAARFRLSAAAEFGG